MEIFNEKYKDNLIVIKSFEFAKNIVKYSEILQQNKKFVIANQIVRSGTSIGANIKEAQNAGSKADFIHKLKIAMKEAEETEFWLFLCNELESYPSNRQLLLELSDIIRITNRIISTTKNKKQ